MFCSVLFCFVLFCFILFCSSLFCSAPFYSIRYCFILFCYVLPYFLSNLNSILMFLFHSAPRLTKTIPFERIQDAIPLELVHRQCVLRTSCVLMAVSVQSKAGISMLRVSLRLDLTLHFYYMVQPYRSQEANVFNVPLMQIP